MLVINGHVALVSFSSLEYPNIYANILELNDNWK